MARRITNRELQAEVNAVAMANVETSIFNTLTSAELRDMEASIRANRRINHGPADVIAEILRRREASDLVTCEKCGCEDVDRSKTTGIEYGCYVCGFLKMSEDEPFTFEDGTQTTGQAEYEALIAPRYIVSMQTAIKGIRGAEWWVWDTTEKRRVDFYAGRTGHRLAVDRAAELNSASV